MDLGHHHQLSFKHSKSCVERESSSSSVDDQMHGESFEFDHGIKDKKTIKKSKTTTNYHQRNKASIFESGSSSSDSKGAINVITLLGEINGKNSNHSDHTHINGTEKNIPSSSARRNSSTSTSTSSISEDSSSDNYISIEEAYKYTKPGKHYASSSESFDKNDLDNNNLVVIPPPTYDVYNNLSHHSQKDLSPTSSPSMQVMNRSERYGASSIIPSSIFETNANPSDWSIASNDSLFSIQIGQPSFTREHAFMYAAELGLSRQMSTKNGGELNNPSPSVILEENISTDIKSVDAETLQTIESLHGSFKLEGEGLSEGINNEIIKTAQQATTSYEPSKSNVSIHSHSSDTGIGPIPFPVKKRTRKLAYLYDCRWMFCHLWSSFECSNGFGGLSCCQNCNRSKHRHRTSPILTEAAEKGNDSMKIDIPQQQSDKQEAEVKTNDSSGSSCSCFQSKQESEVTSNSSNNGCHHWFQYCPSCCTFSCTSCKCC